MARLHAAGDLPAAQLEEVLEPRADQRTKQHIELLRCLGLVESVVIPDEGGERPVPLAPTVASRQVMHPCSMCRGHAEGSVQCLFPGG